jgi:hypothetical protein
MAAGVRFRTLVAPILLLALLAPAVAAPSDVADPVNLRVGNSAAHGFSFIPVDLHLVDGDVDMSKLYTEAYLPEN